MWVRWEYSERMQTCREHAEKKARICWQHAVMKTLTTGPAPSVVSWYVCWPRVWVQEVERAVCNIAAVGARRCFFRYRGLKWSKKSRFSSFLWISILQRVVCSVFGFTRLSLSEVCELATTAESGKAQTHNSHKSTMHEHPTAPCASSYLLAGLVLPRHSA